MTQDEIIEMARQAGMMTRVLYLGRNLELLTNFAKLAAKHTLLNIDPSSFMSYQEGVEVGRFAEREACAKVCETLWDTPTNGMATEEEAYGDECAAAIRARGQA